MQSFSGFLAASACDFFADQGPLEVPCGPFKNLIHPFSLHPGFECTSGVWLSKWLSKSQCAIQPLGGNRVTVTSPFKKVTSQLLISKRRCIRYRAAPTQHLSAVGSGINLSPQWNKFGSFKSLSLTNLARPGILLDYQAQVRSTRVKRL